MANGGPNTNGSQFFITEVPYPSLDNRHTVFGELVKGIEIQDSISNLETTKPRNKPLEDVIMQEINIIRVGLTAKTFDAPKVFNEELPKIKEKQEKIKEEMRLKAEAENKEREAKNAAAGKELKPLLDDYLAKSSASASGLKTYFIVEGKGEKPKQGSKVKVNYEGYFTDGRLFDSNKRDIEEKHGMLNQMKVQREMYNPMPMQISPDARMIAGFKEAVSQLKVGDKAFFYLPYHLAYGERANGPIPAKSDLIFIVEMLEIVKPVAPQ